MQIQANTLILTESEVNELRFILSNINSPSRIEADKVADDWRIKLAVAMRQMHPSPMQTVNVD